jgi:hypothetical protein
MAEKEPSALNVKQQMSAVGANIEDIFNVRKKILVELAKADKSGDVKLARELAGKVSTLSSALERQEKNYDVFAEQEAEEKIQDVSGATSELRSGTYKLKPQETPSLSQPSSGSGRFSPMSTFGQLPQRKAIDVIDEEKKQRLSTVSGLPPEEINTKSELTGMQKLWMSAMVNPESKLNYLKKEFGQDAVFPVDLDGSTEFLVRKPEGGAFSTEFRGPQRALGFAVVEVPVTAAEIAAGLGTLAGTKSPSLAIISAGATRTALGTIVDNSVEALAGVKPDFMTAFTNRGLEGGVSIVSGFGIDRASSKFLANRIAPNFANEFAQRLETSAANLTRRTGREVTIPAGAGLGGPRALQSQQELASVVTDAPFVGQMKRMQNFMYELIDSYKTGKPVNPRIYQDTARAIGNSNRELFEQVGKAGGVPAQVVETLINKRVNNIAAQAADVDELGKFALEFGARAEKTAVDIKNATYGKFHQEADNSGFEVNAADLLREAVEIRRGLSRGGAFDSSAITRAEKALQAKVDAPRKIEKLEEIINEKGLTPKRQKKLEELENLAKPIDSKDFDGWIQRFRESKPEDATGGTTGEQLAEGVANKISEYRRRMYSGYDATMPDGSTANLGDLFDGAVKVYDERMAFERGTLGSLLKDDYGNFVKQPREAVSLIMREPSRMNEFLSALKKYEAEDPALAGSSDRAREMMQRQYFENLGFNKPGVSISTVKYDKGIIETLFGKSSVPLMKSFDELNKLSKTVNVSKSLTFDDVKSMSQVLDENSRKKLIQSIKERTQYENKIQNLANSEVFKLAKKGQFEKIDPDLMANTILSNSFTTAQTHDLMLQLSRYAAKTQGGSSANARSLFKQDFIKRILDDFPGGMPTTTSPHLPLFDTVGFAKAMDAPTGPSALRKKLEVVIGRDTVQNIYDIATVYNANIIKSKSTDGIEPRVVGGGGGLSAYLSGSITQPIRNRLLSIMLSSDNESRLLRKALAKDINGGEVDLAYRQMFKNMFTTRNGIQMLAYQGSKDEEFSNYLSTTAKEFREDSVEFEKQMENLAPTR